jgi:hypothetical protein
MPARVKSMSFGVVLAVEAATAGASEVDLRQHHVGDRLGRGRRGLLGSARIWPAGHSPAYAGPMKAGPTSRAEATRVRVIMGISIW